MRKRYITFPSQKGRLVVRHAEDNDGRVVIIYGDPDGLRSFGELLIAEANLDQKQFPQDNMPWDTGHHLHLYPGTHIHPQSIEVIVQRLDGQKTGATPDWFAGCKMKRERRLVEEVTTTGCRTKAN